MHRRNIRGAGGALLLRDYVSRVVLESSGAAGAESISVANSELTSLSALLAVHAPNGGLTVHNSVHMIVASLAAQRSARLGHLATTYPPVHFVVLTTIAASILLA